MATFRVTLMVDIGKQGFSETWYLESGNFNDAERIVKREFVPKRDLLLGVPGIIQAARLTQVDPPTNGETRLISSPGFSGLSNDVSPTAGNVADYPNSSVLARCSAVGEQKRQLWLRGIPDSWVARAIANPNAMTLNNDVLIEQFNKFAKYVQAGNPNWLIRALDKGNAAAPLLPISTIASAANGYYTITTTAAHGCTEGQKVVIRRAKGVNVARALGQATVVAVLSPTAVSISKRADPDMDVLYLGRGTMQKVIYKYARIDRVEMVRAASRKVGRAFFVPAGRRKAR